jgi:hypothetical protein
MVKEALRIYTPEDILEDARKSLQEAIAAGKPPPEPHNFALEQIAFYSSIVLDISREWEARIEVEEEADDDWCLVSMKASQQA